jgi:hypothetical protein
VSLRQPATVDGRLPSPARSPRPLRRALLPLLAASLLVAVGCGPRPFPDTSDGIHVFNDQLLPSQMTEAQVQFAAYHYAGSQKLTRADAQRIRQYNPDFIVLHYRLGMGLGYRSPGPGCQPSGDYLQIVEGDGWVQEWPGEAAVQDGWFFPQAGRRVYNCDWGWYLMNPDDPGWRAYWSSEVLRQMQANEDDGVFADSFSVPNYLGTYDPPLPGVDAAFEADWAGRLARFTDYVRERFAGLHYFLVNAGSLITSRDPYDYAGVDGVMVEGFALNASGSYYDQADWALQMDRALALTRQDKIIIGQSYVESWDTQGRLFSLASYLLVKGSHSFINLDTGLDPEWFPEYEVDIGTASQPPASTAASLLDPAWGVYRRDYSSGLVLVNPGASSRSIDLGRIYYRASPQGGGTVPPEGRPANWRVQYDPVTSLTLGPHEGAILLDRPGPGCACSG